MASVAFLTPLACDGGRWKERRTLYRETGVRNLPCRILDMSVFSSFVQLIKLYDYVQSFDIETGG